MIRCNACNRVFQTFLLVKSHINFFHKHLRTFSCVFEDCVRIYPTFHSYKRHYLREHTGHSAEPMQPSTVSGSLPQESLDSVAGEQHPSSSLSDTNLTEKVEQALGKVFSSLYANCSLQKKSIDAAYNKFHFLLRDAILPAVEVPANSDKINDICKAFDNLQSEYKRMSYFKRRGFFIEPRPYTVSMRHELKMVKGVAASVAVENVAHIIPLREVLQQFFSLPGVMLDTLSHLDSINNHDSSLSLSHFMQGTFWRSRELLHGNKLTFPLFLHVDEFNPLEGLSAHSNYHKLGAAYISVACLPPQYASRLSSIFLALLWHSSDNKSEGNLIIFKPLIDEFNYLATKGINIDVEGYKGKVFFDLALALGDNLGLHSLMGFSESFSGNYPCRMCKIHKKDLATQYFLDSSLIRNMTNYEEDLKKNDVSQTGIKEKSIWLQLPNFHLFDQMGVDVLHDLDLGVSKYIMCEVILALLKKKYFSLNLLNSKLAYFDLGPDSSNRPVQLSIDNLNNSNLRLTASEMNNLVLYFSVMLGSSVPRGDEIWSVYLQLRCVLSIIKSPKVVFSKLPVLTSSIAKLCELYCTVFNTLLKPKFHYLLHYVDAMKRLGPVKAFSSVRYEGKHQPNKTASRTSRNRINMTLTIANRHQLILNEIFATGKLKSFISSSKRNRHALKYSQRELLNNNLGFESGHIRKASRVSELTYCSCVYRNGTIVVLKFDNDSNRVEQFLSITEVYLCNSNLVIFCGLPIVTVRPFDEHYFAYEVQEPLEQTKIYIELAKLPSPYPCHKSILSINEKHATYLTIRSPL